MMKRMVFFLLASALILGLCMLGCAASAAKTFSDVPAGADYAQAVAWCVENDLMNGVGDDSFAPNGSMTRAMLAAVLYRQAGSPAVAGEPSFTDARPNAWYSKAVVWASEKGLLRGYGDGPFGIDDPVSREMLTVVMARQKGEDPTWKGDPALAVPAKRSEAAVALMDAFGPESAGGKVLVAYFSATNNTEGVASRIKTALGEEADLFEIVPETPYTSADLNYNTDCRANDEQNDPGARPAVAASCKVEDMGQYDVIFLGYPIWWGQAPKLLYSFLESYDLSGKTIVPFCTSGSSGVGSSATNLASSAPGATWLSGHRFSASASQSAVTDWVNGLELS